MTQKAKIDACKNSNSSKKKHPPYYWKRENPSKERTT
jgi:hypothetical protein